MIDELYSTVKSSFDGVSDHRMAGGNKRYSLGDVMMCGFAMFSLKDPSLLIFRQRVPERQENLTRVYGINAIPADTALRETLDGVNPLALQPVLNSVLKKLETSNLWNGRKVLGDYLAVCIDGTGVYCSSKKPCEHCLEKKRGNGKVEYHHQLLAAVQALPGEATVFPVDVEPIQRQDGETKNDCEQNAAKRLIPRLKEKFPPDSQLLVLLDALYPKGPFIRLLKENGINFIIRIKEGHILAQAEDLWQTDRLPSYEWQEGGTAYTVRWAEQLIHSASHPDLTVNYFEVEQADASGEVVYAGAWITNLPVQEAELPEMVAVARCRWKVENETFNTLKNQGYNLEHSYGHGKKYLASVLAVIMMIAFLVDQIAQYADSQFQKTLAYCKTKKNMWEKVRQVFDLIPCSSMNVIYRFLVKEITINMPLLI